MFFWVSASSDCLCSSWILSLCLRLGIIPPVLTCWSGPHLHFFLCPKAKPSLYHTNVPVQSSVLVSFLFKYVFIYKNKFGPGTQEEMKIWARFIWLPWYLSWQRIHLPCRRSWFDSWVGKIHWRRDRLPTPVFWHLAVSTLSCHTRSLPCIV